MIDEAEARERLIALLDDMLAAANAPEARTVTVTRERRDRFTVSFSALPGRTFGPWSFAETVRDLQVSALLTAREARDLVLDADASGITRRLES